MGFSNDDRILIENLYIFKGYEAKKNLLETFRIKVGVCADLINCWENFETLVRQREAAADDLELRG